MSRKENNERRGEDGRGRKRRKVSEKKEELGTGRKKCDKHELCDRGVRRGGVRM